MRSFFVKHTEFIGNVAIMMSGRMIAALVALFTVPIVARLFTPDDFGVAAMFVSIVGIVSTIASLRYGATLMLPKDDAEATKLMALSYRITIFVCFLLLICTGLYKLSGETWSALELIGGWLWLLPLAILFASALNIQESWLTRKKSFKVVSSSLVVGNATTSAVRIGFGALLGSSVLGLIAGYFLGILFRIAVQSSAARDGVRSAFTRVGWPEMRRLARRYSDFPKFNAPAGFVFELGQSMPTLLFGAMFSPAAAGFYAMANRLTQVPITIVAASMRRVFLQKAAEISNRGGSLRKAFLLSIGGLAVLGVVPFACLWTYGQTLSTWVLGERWFEAGRYLEVMAPWLFMVWVASPCNAVFIILRKQKSWLSLITVAALLRLGTFGIAYIITADPLQTLQAFVMVTVIGQLITILIALALVSKNSSRPSGIESEA